MLNILSGIPQGIELNIDTDNLEYSNFVYMCIKNINQSEYYIPDNIKPLIEQMINNIHKLSPHMYDNDHRYYCYLTLKKMYVQPNTFGNREGWHIDGFLGGDQVNFIWSDSLPTEVAIGKFNISEDHHKSLSEIKEQVQVVTNLESNTLYMLDQTCVHRPAINSTDKTLLRTFVKITFTTELFNGFGNAWNYKLPHIKPSKYRDIERNHGVI